MFKNYRNSNTKIRNKSESNFYNVKKILYGSDGKPCDFIIGDKTGDPSSYGTAFDACCASNDSNCNYVLKKLNTLNERNLIKEVEIQMKASKSNLAPKVILSYITDLECGFVMERLKPIEDLFLTTIQNEELLREFIGDELDLDLFNDVVSNPIFVVEKDYSKYISFKNEFDRILDNKRKVLIDIISKIKQLHKIGIAHEDTHLRNIMLDNRDNIKFIDFGLSLNYDYEIDSEDDYEILKRSLKSFVKRICKIKEEHDENSIEYLKYLIVEYHFSYLEEEFDELI